MNKNEQKWLVLLYSMIELDGGGLRRDVLRYIQKQGYWYKDDGNDLSRPSRNEKVWRNDFSFERLHLVKRGYMQDGINGIWKITEAGRAYTQSQIEKLANLRPQDVPCLSKTFYQKVLNNQQHTDAAADRLLLELLSEPEESQEPAPLELVHAPLPKGPVLNRSGKKATYLRDPATSRRALARAGYRCEADPSHPSFLRKNTPHLYMEPHHLIPMSKTDDFGVSLDREQNIFSLCSNCHNQIHYGTSGDVRELVSRLFLSRQEEICAILGRTITLEEVFQLYNV